MKNPHFVRIQKILGPLVRFLFPITLEGAENLPDDRPVMLCANHSSAWDPILFVAAIWTGYPLRIMAKKQLLRIPILGSILKAIGVFAVDRGNSDILAVKTAIQSLKQGWNLLIFPEGTTTDGNHVHPFHAALLQPAIDAGAPIQPLALCYRLPDGSFTRAPAYDGDVSLLDCLKAIVAEREIVARIHVTPQLATAELPDRKRLSQSARSAIVERLEAA